MIADTRTTLLVESTFPSLALACPMLDRLSQTSCVELTIRHGRLPRDEAQFEFEISGENDEVEGVVRTVRQWGCAV